MQRFFVILIFLLPVWAVSSQEVGFIEHRVAAGVQGLSGLDSADLDGDGDRDIVGASFSQHRLYWWRNEGGEPLVWTQHEIGVFSNALYVACGDLDGNGVTDVAVCGSKGGDRVSWWRNDAGDGSVWTEVVIDSVIINAQGIHVADIDGDGDTDVAAVSRDRHKVFWYENGNGSGTVWNKHLIGQNFFGTQSLCIGDIDSDGDMDVAAGAGTLNDVAWWRNDGGHPVTWTQQVIDTDFRWVHWVEIADVDGDGHQDILAAGYTAREFAWWRNSGRSPITWTKQSLTSDFRGALTVKAADMDGDGDTDVVGCGDIQAQLTWWRNNGGNPLVWGEDLIKGGYQNVWPLQLDDLDGDGDMDIVTAATDRGLVDWFENTLQSSPVGQDPVAGPALFELKGNSPNPFNPQTVIRYTLNRTGPVSLTLFNSRGRRVRRLLGNEAAGPGDYTAIWDGRNDLGQPQSSGVYFCRLVGEGAFRVMKMVLMK